MLGFRNKKLDENNVYEKSKDLNDLRSYINNLKTLTNELSEKDEQIMSIQEDYKKIFNLFSDSVVIIDAEGFVIDLNRKAQISMKELKCEKVIGERWESIIKKLGCSWENSIERQVLESDALMEKSKEIYMSDVNKYFLITILPIRKNNKADDYFIFTARDITKIRERERELIKKHDLIKYVDQISDTFHKNFNINYIMEKIVEILGNIEDVDLVYIYRNYFNEYNNLYAEISKVWTKDSLKHRIKEFKNLYYSDYPRWEEYFKTNHIICGSVNKFPKNEKQLLLNKGIKSTCVVPIYTPINWWGFIGFDSTEKYKEWSFDEEKILKITANIIGSGIYQWTLRNNNNEILNKTCINF